MPRLWLDPLDQNAAEDVRPGVVRGVTRTPAVRAQAASRVRVGRLAGGQRRQQIDAGKAVESVHDRDPLGLRERVALSPRNA